MNKKRAREPKWWGNFFELYYPRMELGILNKWALEKKWFQNFLNNLPNKCPFERQYWLFDKYLILYVPALCKFNPFFYQLMRLKVLLFEED